VNYITGGSCQKLRKIMWMRLLANMMVSQDTAHTLVALAFASAVVILTDDYKHNHLTASFPGLPR